MTTIEQFPNELILTCFSYLDFYHIYEIFFHLNTRFNQLILYQTKIHFNFSSISSRQIFTFCSQLNQLTKTSENYPYSIVAHGKHKLKLILEDDLFSETFSKLRSLTLSNTDCETICLIIFDYPTKLYENLEILNLLDNITEKNYKLKYNRECKKTLRDIQFNLIYLDLCNNLISSKMKSLKYLKLNFNRYPCGYRYYMGPNHIDLYFDQFTKENKSLSNLETLIIGCKVSISVSFTLSYMLLDSGYQTCTIVSLKTLTEKLLPRLSKLKNLLIDFLEFDNSWSGEERVCTIVVLRYYLLEILT
jgi:hypothetical protein